MKGALARDLHIAELRSAAQSLLGSGGRMQMVYAWYPPGEAPELSYVATPANLQAFEVWRCKVTAEVCPTEAIKARLDGRGLDIDNGSCVVCQLCTEACPTDALAKSSDWAFGMRHRDDLRWVEHSVAEARERDPQGDAFRRSLHIRHVGSGCPPNPAAIIQALLMFLGRAPHARKEDVLANDLLAAAELLWMHDGWLLVPLTATFAFISPGKLVIVMPLLSLVPIGLLLLSRGLAVRRVPIWYGGIRQNVTVTATAALTFSNALRTFYSFNYRPTAETEREVTGREYFVKRLVFNEDVAAVFGPYLFAPSVRVVRYVADRARILQSGHLNFYLGLIGLLLVIILGLALL